MIFGHTPSQKPISTPASFTSSAQPVSPTTDPAGFRSPPGDNGTGDGGRFTASDMAIGSPNTGPGSSGLGASSIQGNLGLSAPVLCTGSDVFEQTKFLGATIMDFSVSLGYGEQSSSISVRLVEDDCVGNSRIYYNGHKNLKIGNNSTLEPVTTTRADNFDPPSPGSPVYFRCGTFEFAGLLQSWTKQNNTSGRPTYTVTVNDPREILDGLTLIINDEVLDPVYVSNIMNVYGVMERYGSACSQSPVGGFGGSYANNEGMPWNRILIGINLLQGGGSYFSGIPPKRPIFKSAQYLLDLTDLPVAPGDYRISGSSVTLLDAIGQLCEAAGRDYFVDLVPLVLDGGVLNILKVRTVDRTAQPSLTAIEDFVSATDNLVTENSQGLELRNEVTNAMIIGGKRQEMYQCECPFVVQGCNPAGLQPYWGEYENENLITGCRQQMPGGGGAQYVVALETSDLNATLGNPLPVHAYQLTEEEMRVALAGQKSWMAWVCSMPGHVIKAHYFGGRGPAMWGIDELVGVLEKMDDNPNGMVLNPRDMVMVNRRMGVLAEKGIGAGNNGEQILKDLRKIFDWVRGVASKYGKQWLVPVYSEVCVSTDTSSGLPVTSLEPTDGGWPTTSALIGLNYSVYNAFFGKDDGRIEPFLRYNLRDMLGAFGGGFGQGMDQGNKLDVSSLNPENYVVVGNYLWAKCNVGGGGFKYLNKNTLYGPHVLVKTGSVIKTEGSGRLGAIQFFFAAMASVLEANNPGQDNIAALNRIRAGIGANQLNHGMAKQAWPPEAATVPLKSNIATYGPWESYPIGPAGKTAVQANEDLVPWNYAGLDLMSIAGQSLANQQVTFMQMGETGSVTVPGYPSNIKIGWELNDIGGSNNAIVTNRNSSSAVLTGGGSVEGETSEHIYVEEGTLNNSNGPTITEIHVTIGAAGVTTQYNFRTYTPRFGRFAKSNADRLKRMGRARMRIAQQQRKIAKAMGGGLGPAANFAFGGAPPTATESSPGDTWGNDDFDTTSTPNGAPADNSAGGASQFIGTTDRMDTPNPTIIEARRSIVASMTSAEIAAGEVEDEQYARRAMMGQEGLLRPVSMAGGGGLPQYYTNLSDPCENSKHLSLRPMPPINGLPDDALAGVAKGDYKINLKYLNPFTNPDGMNYDEKHVDPDDDSTEHHGHDIDYIARGSTPPGHQSIAISEHQDEADDRVTYTDDYRMFAIRGPMIMTGWGYDLQGKPIPNEADGESAAAGGSFQSNNLTDNFLANFLRKSHTWPVAPVDLRFDRKRGVWTTPPPPRFVLLELTTDEESESLSPGNDSGQVEPQLQKGESTVPKGTNGKHAIIVDEPEGGGISVYDEDGSIVADKYVIFKADLSSYKMGEKIRAFYDDYECIYKPFGASLDAESCTDIVIACMMTIMEPGNNGVAKIDWPEDQSHKLVTVVNSLHQPIAAGMRVILWKTCEKTERVTLRDRACDSSGDCPDGFTCVDGRCVQDKPSASATEDAETSSTDGYTYRVLQAEFCPLCVVTSIAIEETYPGSEKEGTGECTRPYSYTADYEPVREGLPVGDPYGIVTVGDKEACTRVRVDDWCYDCEDYPNGAPDGPFCGDSPVDCTLLKCCNTQASAPEGCEVDADCPDRPSLCCQHNKLYAFARAANFPCGGEEDVDNILCEVGQQYNKPKLTELCLDGNAEYVALEATDIDAQMILDKPELFGMTGRCGIDGFEFETELGTADPYGIMMDVGSCEVYCGILVNCLVPGECAENPNPPPARICVDSAGVEIEDMFLHCQIDDCNIILDEDDEEIPDPNALLTSCTWVPKGAISVVEIDNGCLTSAEYAVGSFKLKACTEFNFELEVEHPVYPILHINVCERTIYLQSAYSKPYCSFPREPSNSFYAGSSQIAPGLPIPVFGEPTFDCETPTDMVQTTCYGAEANSTDFIEDAAVRLVDDEIDDEMGFEWQACTTSSCTTLDADLGEPDTTPQGDPPFLTRFCVYLQAPEGIIFIGRIGDIIGGVLLTFARADALGYIVFPCGLEPWLN